MILPVEKLILAYTNEKATKKLLPYNTTVDLFINEIRNKTLDDSKQAESIVNEVVEIELNRLKFYIKEYLRCRLHKICINLFVPETNLVDKERCYRKKLLKLLEERNLLVDEKDKEIEYVGFEVCRNIDKAILDGEVVDLIQGDFYIANIDEICDKIASGEIRLV